MNDAVDRILSHRRAGRGGDRLGPAVLLALLLHAGVFVAFALAPHPGPPEPLEFVAVRIVPLQALGRPEPARRPTPPAEPEPAEVLPAEDDSPPEEPEPTPEPEPVSEPEPPKPTGDAADQAAEGETTDDRPGRVGGTEGSPEGSSPFGASELVGIDPNFRYDYYLDRMLSMIHGQWNRPPVGTGVEAVVRFTVERGGAVTELELERESGYPAFDLAALRAVRNAGPFPRLPASYRQGELRVTLIVR